MKFFILNRKQLLVNFGDIKKQKVLQRNKFFNKQFLILSPRIFTNFIKKQLTTISFLSWTSINFNKNLQKNILKVIRTNLRLFKFNIIGLKIIISGKWKKTNTGRTQKIYLKYGKIQNSNTRNKVIYQNIAQKTKFGMFSMKMWISQKI